MIVSPQTDIFLLKCPLTLNNKHQITFASKTAQYNYFQSLPKIECDNASYLRKNEVIRYPAQIDDILEYNYCMYQNENYDNKWFYAFITDMRYINDGMTEISIATDVFQSWQFDLIYKQSFIEREMVNVSDDVPEKNLVPEGLETGEYIIAGKTNISELAPAFIIAFSGDTLGGTSILQRGNSYNGIPSSVDFILANSIEALQIVLETMNTNAEADKILTVFSIPRLAVLDALNEIESEADYGYILLDYSYFQNAISKTLSARPTTIDNYTPRNKKLLQYPYLYFAFNPTTGTEKIFRYENFSSSPVFDIISEINPNPSVNFIPKNYRNQNGDSLSDLATLNGYPTIAYKTDVFNTWLAQNSQIVNLQMEQEAYNSEISITKTGMGMLGDIGSIATGNFGGIGGFLEKTVNLASIQKNHEYYVKNMMAQVEKQKMLPDKANLSGSNATLLGYNKFQNNIFTTYSIKREFAERIDKYFDMYGYTVNKVKEPNLNNRPNWNYVKMQGANILGNIPQQDLYQIKEFFDNGITLWHNPSTFLDYSQNNR